MAQTIAKSSKDIVNVALAAVPAISAEEAMLLLDTPDHVFVDLREGTEQAKTGMIPGTIASSPTSLPPRSSLASAPSASRLKCRWMKPMPLPGA